jgi:hypothetical protein
MLEIPRFGFRVQELRLLMEACMIEDEYVTTSAEWSEHGRFVGGGAYDAEVPDPEVPGPDYVLMSSAATETRLFWFWKKVPAA